MELVNPPNDVNFIRCTSGELLRCTIIPIGDWNMDADNSKLVTNPFSTNFDNIRSISVMIRNDSGVSFYQLPTYDSDNDQDACQAGCKNFQANNFYLHRRIGGTFDNVNFDSVGYNRGWITVWCED